jgi:hypothetical protein
MTEWRNENRHTRRKPYRPSLRIFPAGMSTLDKMKAIAPWLVVLCVIVIVTFYTTNSWGKTIILSLLFGSVWLVKELIGNNNDNNESEY